jgi:hypothetical protein
MSGAPNQHASPVLTTKEAAVYCRRTPNAMKILRHRRKGPKSFEQGGRIYYYRSALDAWLADGAASDSRSNRELDPTLQAPEPKRLATAA